MLENARICLASGGKGGANVAAVAVAATTPAATQILELLPMLAVGRSARPGCPTLRPPLK